MRRFGWWAAVALAAAVGRADAAAQPPAMPGAGAGGPFNVDCDVGWQGRYRPLDWVPVDVNVAGSLKEPFEGVLTVAAEQDEMTTMRIAHRFVLTPDVPVWLPLVAKLAFGVSDCRVSIQDVGGRTVWQRSYGLCDPEGPNKALTPVESADLFIGVSGRMAFGLRHLPRAAHCRTFQTLWSDRSWPRRASSTQERTGKVVVADRLQRRLPWDWTGYQSLDLLVLYDPEWTAFAPQQSEAIARWVSGGGNLVIVLGAHPLPPGHPIAKLLPLEVGEARQLTIGPQAAREWGCDAAPGQSVTAWGLDRVDAWGWAAEAHGTDRTLYAWGPAGFGRVAVLAFDPSALGGSQGTNVAPFWVSHLAKVLDVRTLAAGPEPPEKDDRPVYGYELDESAAASNVVLNYLLDIPEMQPISIVWVILLLLALAVIIGPVDYFVLKRRDRLPLTWLTFTAYIVVFSVAAYFGVKALRGGKTQFRAVSVVDGVEGDPDAWHCCTSAIFAPESDDYRLSGLARGQWWASLAPSSGEYLYASGRRGTRGITCAQEDGGNLPTYLPISIWSMQCLLTESACDEMPIAAQVQRDLNTLHATVTNRSDWPILRGTIRVDGDRVVPFGTIPPRSSAKVDGTLVSAASWSSELSAVNTGPLVVLWGEQPTVMKEGAPFCAQGTLRRTRAILNRLEQGAAVVCAEYQQAPLAYGLADRRHQVVHRQWVRLLVIPGKGPPS